MNSNNGINKAITLGIGVFATTYFVLTSLVGEYSSSLNYIIIIFSSAFLGGAVIAIMLLDKKNHSVILAILSIIGVIVLLKTKERKFPKVDLLHIENKTWLNYEGVDSLLFHFSTNDTITIETPPHSPQKTTFEISDSRLRIYNEFGEIEFDWLMTMHQDSLFFTDGEELLKFWSIPRVLGGN